MKNPLSQLFWAVQRAYYLYTIYTGVFMLQFKDKVAMNLLFFSIFATILYSSVVYLPLYVMTIFSFLLGYYTAADDAGSRLMTDTSGGLGSVVNDDSLVML